MCLCRWLQFFGEKKKADSISQVVVKLMSLLAYWKLRSWVCTVSTSSSLGTVDSSIFFVWVHTGMSGFTACFSGRSLHNWQEQKWTSWLYALAVLPHNSHSLAQEMHSFKDTVSTSMLHVHFVFGMYQQICILICITATCWVYFTLVNISPGGCVFLLQKKKTQNKTRKYRRWNLLLMQTKPITSCEEDQGILL